MKDKGSAINSIANQVPIDLKHESPLTGGNQLALKTIIDQMPFSMGNKPQSSGINQHAMYAQNYDDSFTPNLFGSWMDIYESFIGSYSIVSAPNEIKRHERGMLHLLFIQNQFALFKGFTGRYLLGNYSSQETDEYGRITKGKFIPFGYWNSKPDESKTIDINKTNQNLIVQMNMNIYNIPLFVAIKYFVHMRNILYQYKNVNLRLSSLNTIVGVKGGGKEVLENFLRQLFNLDSTQFPNPIQVMDISLNEKNGDVSFNFVDLSNQIKIPVEYKGNEINLDIDSMTKELFRVSGLRYDTSASSGTFQDRPSKSQINQASNYFDTRENSVLKAFESFSMDMKDKFNVDIKWESTYQKRTQENVNDDTVQDI